MRKKANPAFKFIFLIFEKVIITIGNENQLQLAK